MDLAAILIIILTIISAVFFFLTRYITRKNLAHRDYLLSKFKELKYKYIQLKEEFANLVVHTLESDATYLDLSEYHEALSEKIEVEYSNSEYNKLKNIQLTKDIISEYQEKFKYHQDIIISLRQEIRAYKNSAQIMPTDMKLG